MNAPLCKGYSYWTIECPKMNASGNLALYQSSRERFYTQVDDDIQLVQC